MDAMTWAHNEFWGARVPDRRLLRRLVEVAACIRENPCGTLPRAIRSVAAVKGAYRLLRHPAVTHAGIMEAHIEKTRAACGKPGDYLLIEDTTALSFSKRGPIAGMGPLTHDYSQGLSVHTCLAVRVEGWSETFAPEALLQGVFGQECWARQPPEGTKEERKKAKRKKVAAPAPSLESDRWARALRERGGPPAGAAWTYVADRESDIFEVIEHCQRQGADWIVRASQPRKTATGESVFDAAASAPVLGTYTIALRSRPRKPARTATVEVRACTVSLCAPRRGAARVTTALVEVKEIDPPKSLGEPLHWLLLSSWPCDDLEHARRITGAYSSRWLIEEYHKALKTGTKIEESQLTTARGIEALLAIHSVIAVDLLQLKLLARTRPDDPVRDGWGTPCMLSVLETQHRRPPHGWTHATLLSAVAQWGGYLARKNDGPPGWLSIWRGWLRLSFMAEGYRMALEQKTYG